MKSQVTNLWGTQKMALASVKELLGDLGVPPSCWLNLDLTS